MKLLKLLLIGNSYVIRNNLASILKSFDFQVGRCAGGSATWYSHLKYSSPCIESSEWDVVVMQEQSRLMLHNKYNDNDGVELAKLVNNNSKILLMETWAYENGWSWYTRDQMQSILQKGYVRVAQKIGPQAEPLLVGDTVIHAADNTELKELWDWDGRHPGKDTTMITACMIYIAVTGDMECPIKNEIIKELVKNITI